jgi:hypothetical protein
MTAHAADQCRQHFLNFLPLPQGQGSLRPTLGMGCATLSAKGATRNSLLTLWRFCSAKNASV